jgi:ribosomal protein S12 methylthiotransferase accessory factor
MPFRSVPPSTAVAAAIDEIARLGLTAAVDFLGPSTQRVVLSRGGEQVSVGVGKGAGDQGSASAYFEALERYLMSASVNRRWNADAIRLMRASDIAGQSALNPDLVVQRWAAEFPDTVAACGSYDGVRYPTFLADPRYYRRPVAGDDVRPYRSLLRYSSSLGTAAGMTTEESVYHGLCELIEHDAVSQALLRWYVAGDHTADAAPSSAPGVLLFDVTTDLGIPVYLAATEVDGRTRYGSGASWWASDAADRALTELTQQLAGAPSTASARLAAWPVLRRCAEMPLPPLLASIRPVPLRSDPPGPGSPAWGLAEVAKALAEHGIRHYSAEIAPVGSLISVATTIAPGLERFSLVHHGVPVVPTGRGRHLWPSPAEAAGVSFT